MDIDMNVVKRNGNKEYKRGIRATSSVSTR